MITIEELSAYNRKLVDMNLKLRKENKELKKRNSDEECLKRLDAMTLLYYYINGGWK